MVGCGHEVYSVITHDFVSLVIQCCFDFVSSALAQGICNDSLLLQPLCVRSRLERIETTAITCSLCTVPPALSFPHIDLLTSLNSVRHVAFGVPIYPIKTQVAGVSRQHLTVKAI